MARAVPAGPDTPSSPADLSPLGARRRARFRDVPKNEDVYAVFHRHWIVFTSSLGLPILLLAVVAILFGAVNLLAPPGATGWVQMVRTAGNLVVTGGLLLIVLIGIYRYIDWRADHLIITGQRVVMNIETPGLRRTLRDVPMGKVQNVIVRYAALNAPIRKALKVATLMVDTAGLGQVVFEDVSERDAEEGRNVILAMQQGVRAANAAPREQYRQAVVRNILYGTPLPPQPSRVQIAPSPRTGYTWLNVIFPHRPWRDGLQVVWHKHWWYLLQAELVPVGVIVVFEILSLLAGAIGNAMGLGAANPVLPVLGILRVFVYVFAIAAVLWQWADWRNDEYIVTKERVISRDTLPFKLNQTVKETEIRRVVDATVSVIGILPNLLRFGDVVIKTPGEATSFVFAGVPQPFNVLHEVSLRIEAEREREQTQWDRDIQEWLRTYVDARRAEPQPQPPPPPPDNWPLW